MATTEEKRLSIRLSVDNRPVPVGEEVKSAILNDISTGGMQFSAPFGFYNLNIGDLLNFSIKFPDSPDHNIWGEIRHIRHFDDQTTHYGVKFLKLNWPVWNYLSHYQHDLIELLAVQNLADVELVKIQKMQENVAPDCHHIKILSDKPLDGELEDINFGGARFQLGKAIQIDSSVTATFFFEKNMLVVEGVCVWCSRIHQGTNSFLVGINFIHLDQKQFYLLSELVLKLNHLLS